MLQVRLLGEQAITDADGAVRTRSPRTLALLTFLVVHAGHAQPRHLIASTFWPDSSEDQALTNLRRELHHLRQALDDDPSLVVTSRDLTWRDGPTCLVDTRAFTLDRIRALAAAAAGDVAGALAHARAATDRYLGDLLPGGYDDWVLDARAEYESECVELLDLLRDARADIGDGPGAIAAARRRVRLRPLEEIGHRRLIELQGELGDRAGAVSTYHHCASVLERELGVEPDPETRAALDRLLARTSPVGPAPGDAVGRRSGRAAAQLVGRRAEFAVLDALWRTAARGRPGVVLVRGDAGVGKTRLVAELAEAARLQGATVATARCFGAAGQLPLAPVADWLRTPELAVGIAALDPVWRAEAARLVPSVAEGNASPTALRAMVDAWQRHRFFEGLARALIGGGRPTLLVLDNLHWCDQETLAFLAFCVGLSEDAPLLVATTARGGDEQGRDLVEWFARMRSADLATEVVLHPLEVADTAALAEAVSGQALEEEDARLLQATTGGFPLSVVEATRTSADLGGHAAPIGDLSDVLRKRVDAVSEPARAVAEVAATVGRTATLDLLTEAGDMDAVDVVAAVDELWRRRIIREIGPGYDFSHDLLRDAVYARISRPRRWLLHRRVAEALEVLHDTDTDAVAAELAGQYARGGHPGRAIPYYLRAAEVAASRFAHGEAVRILTEARSVVATLTDGEGRRRHELAVLEALAAPLNARSGYSSPELRNTLERTVAVAESLGWRRSVLVALVGLWTSLFVRGDSEAHRVATRVLALVDAGSELEGPAHFAAGGSALTLGRPAEALRHFGVAEDLGGADSLSVGTRPDVHSKAFAAHAHWLLGHERATLDSSRKAISLARTTGNPYSLAVALAYAGVAHQLRGDLAGLCDAVDELRELCSRYDFAYYREWVLILDGWVRGDATGLAQARRGVENLRQAEALVRMPFWLALLADLHQRAGEPASARATLDAAEAAAHAHGDRWWLPEVMRLRAAHDGHDEAAERLRAAARKATDHGSVALLARIEADLAALGVGPRTSVPPRPPPTASREDASRRST